MGIKLNYEKYDIPDLVLKKLGVVVQNKALVNQSEAQNRKRYLVVTIRDVNEIQTLVPAGMADY